MRAFFMVLFIVLAGHISFAQEAGRVVETIKGKVINSVSNEPVSYTNIGLEGTFFGTASDADGNFELKIPAEMVGKNIYFSAVGFVGRKFPVDELFGKTWNLVKIQPQSYDIDDVDVAAQSKVLQRILTLANENIPYNYIAGPYNFTADFEQATTTSGTTKTQKAAVLIYDHSGYAHPSKTDAFRHLNYSVTKNDSNMAYSFAEGMNTLDELLALDWVRTASSVLHPRLLDGFQLELEGESSVNGKNCWVISFTQHPPALSGTGNYYASHFHGKITVVKEDYSVVEISGKMESPKNSRQGSSLAASPKSPALYTSLTSEFRVNYENHKPVAIHLDRTYNFEGKNIRETSTLKFVQARANNLQVLDDRDYFWSE